MQWTVHSGHLLLIFKKESFDSYIHFIIAQSLTFPVLKYFVFNNYQVLKTPISAFIPVNTSSTITIYCLS